MIRIYSYLLFLICLGWFGEAAVPAYAQNATTLALSPLPISTIAAGTVSSGAASSSAVVNEVIVADPRDYTLSSNSPLTLQTEHHGSTTVTATPVSGLSDTVVISCGSLPIYASCEVVPTQVSIGNGTSQNVTVKIDTDQLPGYASLDRHLPSVLAFLVPCLFLGLPLARRTVRQRVIFLGLLAFLASESLGCSGRYPMATPPGTYSIVIHGHGQASGLDRATTLTLIVTAK
jgi:hypothetical protein